MKCSNVNLAWMKISVLSEEQSSPWFHYWEAIDGKHLFCFHRYGSARVLVPPCEPWELGHKDKTASVILPCIWPGFIIKAVVMLWHLKNSDSFTV